MHQTILSLLYGLIRKHVGPVATDGIIEHLSPLWSAATERSLEHLLPVRLAVENYIPDINPHDLLSLLIVGCLLGAIRFARRRLRRIMAGHPPPTVQRVLFAYNPNPVQERPRVKLGGRLPPAPGQPYWFREVEGEQEVEWLYQRPGISLDHQQLRWPDVAVADERLERQILAGEVRYEDARWEQFIHLRPANANEMVARDGTRYVRTAVGTPFVLVPSQTANDRQQQRAENRRWDEARRVEAVANQTLGVTTVFMTLALTLGPMEGSVWVLRGRPNDEGYESRELWVRVTWWVQGRAEQSEFRYAYWATKNHNLYVEIDPAHARAGPAPTGKAPTGKAPAGKAPAKGNGHTPAPPSVEEVSPVRPQVGIKSGARPWRLPAPSSPEPFEPLPAADLEMRQIRRYAGDVDPPPLTADQRARLPTRPQLDRPGFRSQLLPPPGPTTGPKTSRPGPPPPGPTTRRSNRRNAPTAQQ